MKNFDRDFKRVGRMVWIAFAFNILIAVLALGGLGWLVYVLLKHFGVIG